MKGATGATVRKLRRTGVPVFSLNPLLTFLCLFLIPLKLFLIEKQNCAKLSLATSAYSVVVDYEETNF